MFAAVILVASQPVSLTGQGEADQSTQAAEAAALEQRAASESESSRDDRRTGAAPIDVPALPPSMPAEDGVLQPELSETEGAGGQGGAAAEGAVSCPTSGFDGVQPHVAQAGYHLMGVFGISESDVLGVAARPGNPTSDHPRGLALDFIVDTETGYELAAYAEDNTDALGISYILWQVPAHYDHVHISFNEEPGPGLAC